MTTADDRRTPAPPDYASRAAALAAQRATLDATSTRLSVARLGVAGAGLAAIAWTWSAPAPARALTVVVALIGFAVIAVRHAQVDARVQHLDRLAAINLDADARMRRAWADVREWQPVAPTDPHHPYAADLDVTGRASLLHLLGRARTGPGDARLAGWLLDAAPPHVVTVRQHAARALAGRLEWRQELAADALVAATLRPAEQQRFLEWCERPSWLRARPWLYALFVAVAVLVVAALVVSTRGGPQAPLGIAGLVALTMSVACLRRYHHELEDASWQAALRGWRAMFDRIDALGPTGTWIDEVSARLVDGGVPAGRALDGLDRIVGFGSLRHTPLLHWPIHLATMYDAHVWWALDAWRAAHGARVRGWFEAVADVEAVCALAGLAADHPGWAWPVLDTEADALEAEALAHPLIAPSRAVDNDLRVGPQGTTVFVTGSNMSGKSTLLRAIGLNAVLAQAGGPVCARGWRMPPVRVLTSMRLADSLEDGVSFFMASLARLKLVVDAATSATTQPGAPCVLYLLDELLAGTNTAEREVAVRGVLRRLLRCRAIGAITSHDLGLASTPEVQGHAALVHFREQLTRGTDRLQMSFDYVLRPGIATSRNALALMEVVGLGEVVAREAASPDDAPRHDQG